MFTLVVEALRRIGSGDALAQPLAGRFHQAGRREAVNFSANPPTRKAGVSVRAWDEANIEGRNPRERS